MEEQRAETDQRTYLGAGSMRPPAITLTEHAELLVADIDQAVSRVQHSTPRSNTHSQLAAFVYGQGGIARRCGIANGRCTKLISQCMLGYVRGGNHE